MSKRKAKKNEKSELVEPGVMLARIVERCPAETADEYEDVAETQDVEAAHARTEPQ